MPIYAFGENPFLGLDSRAGLTANDGAAIGLFAVGGFGKIIRVNMLVDFTAFTSGSATYTLSFAENGVTETISVVATALNTPVGVVRLIRPDNGSGIFVQLTGTTFSGTVKVACILEDMV